MNRRILSFILILTILVSTFSWAIYGDKSNEEVVKIMVAQGFKEHIRKGYDDIYLNPYVYREQQQIVYSCDGNYIDLRSVLSENQPESENYDGKEWRYLGYNQDGLIVANEKFTPDVNPYGGALSSRNWQKSSGAEDSWQDLRSGMDAYMLATVVEVSSNVDTDSVLKILGSKARNTTQAKEYAIMQTMPGIRANGSVKMAHLTNSGSLLYWVLNIPDLGGSINNGITITPPEDILASEGDDVTFSYGLRHTNTLESDTDLADGADMKGLIDNIYETTTITVNEVILGSPKKYTLDGDLVVRNGKSINIPSSYLHVGQNKVEIDSESSFDSFVNEDKSTDANAHEEFNIVVTQPGVPTPTLSVVPDITEVEVNGATTTVNIELKAKLAGTTIIPPVWRFRLNGEQKVVVGNDTQSLNYTYTKTIDTSAVGTEVWDGEVDIYTKVATFVTATDTANTDIYEGAPPAPFNSKPSVYIKAPSIVVMGEDVKVRITASDKEDGASALDYHYSTPSCMTPSLQRTGETVTFSREGTFTLKVEVEDSGGKTDSSDTTVWVVPPTPRATLDIYGPQKVNRKIKLTSVNSYGSDAYPIDWSKTKFEIIPVEGQNLGNTYVLAGASLTSNMNSVIGYRDIYFQTTQTGKYDIKLTVTNTGGYTGYQTKQLDIQPDVAPTPGIIVPTKVYRDPEDGGEQTSTIYNTSFSPDGDTFDKAVYLRQVDVDNDGNYNEETVQACQGTTWTNLPYSLGEINSHKKELMDNYAISGTEVDSKSPYVGKTRYNLIIAEDYGNRIHSLIPAGDYIFTTIGNSDTKITDTDNMPPVANVSISTSGTKKVDLVVMTDYMGTQLLTLKNQLNSLASEMVEHDKVLDIHYITDKNHVAGTQSLTKQEYKYARIAKLRWVQDGHEYYYSGSGGRTRNEYVYQTVKRDKYLESKYSLTTPSINDFEFGTDIEYRVDRGTDSKHNDYTHYVKKYYKILVYDIGNVIDSAVSSKAYYYQEYQSVFGTVYLYKYNRSKVRSSIRVDLSRVNRWTNTGQSRDKIVTEDLNSFKLSDVTDLGLDEDSEKVLLIASNGYRVNDYTLQDGAEYSFAGLAQEDLFPLIEDDFATFVIAPEEVLDWKYDNNQYSTTVDTQDLTLRDISKAGSMGGIITNPTVSLNYLKGDESKDLISSYIMDNTVVKMRLDEILGQYDSITLDILGDVTLADGSTLELKNYAGIKEYTGNILPLESGVSMARIDSSRQFIQLGAMTNVANHYVYTVMSDGDFELNYDDILAWDNFIGPSIDAVSGQYIYIAEVNSSGQVKRLSVKEVE